MSQTVKLNGPRLAPLAGHARQLVVFLHGYGADGNDLIDIGKSWQNALPYAAFVSPHAHEPCGMSPMGRQWFDYPARPDDRWKGVNQARPVIDAFLDEESSKLGLTGENLALIGFSQGTMMALHVGLRRAVSPAAIIGYSGMIVGEEHLAAEIKSRPSVFLAHGDRDEIIPVAALQHAKAALKSVGIEAETHISRGIGHGIDQEGLRLAANTLSKAFGMGQKPATLS